jgi:hypothetical protein
MNRLPAVLAIALVACVASSSWLWRELRAERERAEVLQTRVLELESMPAQAIPAERPVAPAASPPDAAPAALSVREPKSVVEVAAADASHEHPARVDYRDREARMLRDPQYREARRALNRAGMASTYIDLPASLGISQDEADKLIDLLTEQDLRRWEESVRDPESEEELRKRALQIDEMQRANDAEVAGLLGKAKLAQWKEYQASLGARHQVLQLRTTLSAGPAPLREDQVEPLIAAMYAEQKQVAEALEEYTATLTWSAGQQPVSQSLSNERRVQLSAAANERIHMAAASILSQPQLESLDEMLQRQLDMEKAEYDMMRASEGAARGMRWPDRIEVRAARPSSSQ